MCVSGRSFGSADGICRWVRRSFKSTAESSGFGRGYLVGSRLPLPMICLPWLDTVSRLRPLNTLPTATPPLLLLSKTWKKMELGLFSTGRSTGRGISSNVPQISTKPALPLWPPGGKQGVIHLCVFPGGIQISSSKCPPDVRSHTSSARSGPAK